MIIYEDYIPEEVTLHGISLNGIPISLKVYLSPDNKTMIPQVLNSDREYARRSYSTHKRCECGNIYEISKYCEPCREKKDTEKYNSLPVVPMIFPCFVNDKFYEEVEYLEDDIADGELDISKAEIYPTKKVEFIYPLQDNIYDYINENCDCDLNIDVLELENDLNIRLQNMTPIYEADTSRRMIYEKV